MKVRRVMFFLQIICILFIGYVYLLGLNKLDNDYRIVVGDNVNLRSDDNEKSQVIGKIDIATKVRVLKRTNKKVKVGDKEGEWVYIDSRFFKKGTNETVKGWVFDYYLADLDVFKKIDTYRECKIEGMIGDYLLSYEFYKDASYKRKILEYEKNSTRFVKGKLYRYRDVVVALDEDSHQLFYFRKDGFLCCQEFNEDGTQMCTICK